MVGELVRLANLIRQNCGWRTWIGQKSWYQKYNQGNSFTCSVRKSFHNIIEEPDTCMWICIIFHFGATQKVRLFISVLMPRLSNRVHERKLINFFLSLMRVWHFGSKKCLSTLPTNLHNPKRVSVLLWGLLHRRDGP